MNLRYLFQHWLQNWNVHLHEDLHAIEREGLIISTTNTMTPKSTEVCWYLQLFLIKFE